MNGSLGQRSLLFLMAFVLSAVWGSSVFLEGVYCGRMHSSIGYSVMASKFPL